MTDIAMKRYAKNLFAPQDDHWECGNCGATVNRDDEYCDSCGTLFVSGDVYYGEHPELLEKYKPFKVRKDYFDENYAEPTLVDGERDEAEPNVISVEPVNNKVEVAPPTRCPYCQPPDPEREDILHKKKGKKEAFAFVGDATLVVECYMGEKSFHVEEPIGYCPKCGRKL